MQLSRGLKIKIKIKDKFIQNCNRDKKKKIILKRKFDKTNEKEKKEKKKYQTYKTHNNDQI